MIPALLIYLVANYAMMAVTVTHKRKALLFGWMLIVNICSILVSKPMSVFWFGAMTVGLTNAICLVCVLVRKHCWRR